jgi:hypothetical protein
MKLPLEVEQGLRLIIYIAEMMGVAYLIAAPGFVGSVYSLALIRVVASGALLYLLVWGHGQGMRYSLPSVFRKKQKPSRLTA